MKKLICLMMAVLFIAALCGCSGSSSNTESAPSKTESEPTKAAAAVDIDLTAMSSTMIYSEVQNMMLKPEEYVGKTVKMQGQFNVAEVGSNRYYACLIKDATACCASGVEFDWKGDHSYPDDYPAQDAPITVTGTFTTYKEGEATYCQLKDAELIF